MENSFASGSVAKKFVKSDMTELVKNVTHINKKNNCISRLP